MISALSLVFLSGCGGNPDSEAVSDDTGQRDSGAEEATIIPSTEADWTTDLFNGLLLHQVIAGTNTKTETVEEEEYPWVYSAFQGKGVPFPSLSPDTCRLGRFPPDLYGSLDVGATLDLSVGEDLLHLQRDLKFGDGEVLYLYDPWTGDRTFGADVGGELVLDGTASGVMSPTPMVFINVWDAWETYLGGGLLDLQWEPNVSQKTSEYVHISFWAESKVVYDYVECVFRDDGRAIVDFQLDLEKYTDVWMQLGRISLGEVETSRLGRVQLSSRREIQLSR
jgi:hypothetical protein